MKPQDSLYVTLALALALEASRPTHNRYAEPVLRHAEAILAVRGAISRLDNLSAKSPTAPEEEGAK